MDFEIPYTTGKFCCFPAFCEYSQGSHKLLFLFVFLKCLNCDRIFVAIEILISDFSEGSSTASLCWCF